MKEIQCKGNWCASYAYERICEESKKCNDVVSTIFGNVVMRSDEPIEVFNRRLLQHLAKKQREYIEKKNNPRIKLSVIQDVLTNCVDAGYINEYASHRIKELIIQRHKI